MHQAADAVRPQSLQVAAGSGRLRLASEADGINHDNFDRVGNRFGGLRSGLGLGSKRQAPDPALRVLLRVRQLTLLPVPNRLTE